MRTSRSTRRSIRATAARPARSIYAADGRVGILYREETNNERDMYLALWHPTSNKATKTRVSTTSWKIDSCPMTYYSVMRSGDGFVIAWPTKGEIY